MDLVVHLLARSDVNALSEQTDFLGRLQHELFESRATTQWLAPDDAKQCVSAARALISLLGARSLYGLCLCENMLMFTCSQCGSTTYMGICSRHGDTAKHGSAVCTK